MLRFSSRRCGLIPKPLRLTETPRDALQGLKDVVPTADKIRYVNAILKVGYDIVDVGSFVPAAIMPQMHDTEEVFRGIEGTDTKSKLLAVVANRKGAERACAVGNLHYVAYPLSLSEKFQQRNTKRSIVDALEEVKVAKALCDKHEKELVLGISMAFGNPYQEEYSTDILETMVRTVTSDYGVSLIALADTIGVGDVAVVGDVFTQMTRKFPAVDFSAHFHSTPQGAMPKLVAAYEAGCRRMDCAIGGLGGCPFAAEKLVGNVSTETVIAFANEREVGLKLDLDAFQLAQQIKLDIFGGATTGELVTAVNVVGHAQSDHDGNHLFHRYALSRFQNCSKGLEPAKGATIDEALVSLATVYRDLHGDAVSDKALLEGLRAMLEPFGGQASHADFDVYKELLWRVVRGGDAIDTLLSY